MQLIVDNVGKQYANNFWGVRGIKVTLESGVIGLLGPNGAGKTTLMRVLATVTKATEGTVKWNGKDISRHPNSLRSVLGYLPQDFGAYPNLNAIEFLEYMAAIKGVKATISRKRINELIQLVNLEEAKKRPIGTYSGGMRQRVGIAQALLNDPQLLIVDEPTVGLDPSERVRFRNLIADLSGDRVIILSTHIVSDVEATATVIALLNKGRLLLYKTPEEILKRIEGQVWEWVVPSTELPSVKQNHLISGTIRRSDGVHLRVVSSSSPHASAKPASPSLEDAYLYLIATDRGKGARS